MIFYRKIGSGRINKNQNLHDSETFKKEMF
jgi:hypothetical protein